MKRLRRTQAAMPAQIDFSEGARGKFFKPGARLNVPVYLEAAVHDYLAARLGARVRQCKT